MDKKNMTIIARSDSFSISTTDDITFILHDAEGKDIMTLNQKQLKALRNVVDSPYFEWKDIL